MFYRYLVEKNPNVKYEYERYVQENLQEHYTNRLKHWRILFSLNWHYRVRKKTQPLLFWDQGSYLTTKQDEECKKEYAPEVRDIVGDVYNGSLKPACEIYEKIMNDFKDNKINILISTTVIEVGIDVKNATMIVIFDAFRFGLSALHQLRGRVGRNNLQSYCILISNRETERLNVLTKTNDGFKVSEEDFLLRGSGDLFGLRQSGDMVFKIADIKKDYNILLKAKEDAMEYLEKNKDGNLIRLLEDSIDLN